MERGRSAGPCWWPQRPACLVQRAPVHSHLRLRCEQTCGWSMF